MNVVLVNLYDFSYLINNSVPAGILSLATSIKDSKDFNVKVLDFNRIYESKVLEISNQIEVNLARTVEYILQYKPNVVGFYSMCNTHLFAILAAKLIKNIDKDITIIVGGPHASLTAEETIEEFDCIDVIGLYEGEKSIEDILYGIMKGDLSSVKGVCYKNKGKVILTDKPKISENLDELPYIDFDLLEYPIKNPMSIEVGRGCPYECTFCSTKEFWHRKFRLKSSKRIFDEVVYYKSKYGVELFNFIHDLFTLDKKKVREICQMLIDNKIDITWGCSSRVDTIDKDLLDIMAKSGCIRIYFGIETGSVRMQKKIKKNLKLDRLTELIKSLKKYNIKPTFSFIYGFPEETIEDINETFKLIYTIYQEYRGPAFQKKVTFQLYKLGFLPKTEITNKYYEQLEYQKNSHATVVGLKSIDQWNYDMLNKVAQKRNIFPQYCEYKSEIRMTLKDLDRYFNCIFMGMIGYLDMTYKLIADYFDNDHIKLYLELSKIIALETLDDSLFKMHNGSTKLWAYNSITIFGDFIRKYNFGDYKEIIFEMHDFEASMFNLSLKKNSISFNLEKTYNYDVYLMKKNRSNRIIKKRNVLKFSKNIDVISVEQFYQETI